MFWILHQTLYTHIGVIKVSYTKNEIALETLISNVNNHFSYIGEEEDKVCKSEIKKFTEYCINFIDSLEYEEND